MRVYKYIKDSSFHLAKLSETDCPSASFALRTFSTKALEQKIHTKQLSLFLIKEVISLKAWFSLCSCYCSLSKRPKAHIHCFRFSCSLLIWQHRSCLEAACAFISSFPNGNFSRCFSVTLACSTFPALSQLTQPLQIQGRGGGRKKNICVYSRCNNMLIWDWCHLWCGPKQLQLMALI